MSGAPPFTGGGGASSCPCNTEGIVTMDIVMRIINEEIKELLLAGIYSIREYDIGYSHKNEVSGIDKHCRKTDFLFHLCGLATQGILRIFSRYLVSILTWRV
jgi:hypothetical protein